MRIGNCSLNHPFMGLKWHVYRERYSLRTFLGEFFFPEFSGSLSIYKTILLIHCANDMVCCETYYVLTLPNYNPLTQLHPAIHSQTFLCFNPSRVFPASHLWPTLRVVIICPLVDCVWMDVGGWITLCVCVRACVRVHVCACVRVRVCACRGYVCACVCVRAYVRACVRACVCMRVSEQTSRRYAGRAERKSNAC